MDILKRLVILANIGLAGLLLWSALEEGVPDDGLFQLIYFGALLTFALNIYFVASSTKGGDDLVSLIFRRKALEERKKIRDLETKKDAQKHEKS